MTMLFGKSYILHQDLTPRSECSYSHTQHRLLWVGRNGLPPTPDNLHLGGSYHLHSSHRFLSTWGVVKLERKTEKEMNE